MNKKFAFKRLKYTKVDEKVNCKQPFSVFIFNIWTWFWLGVLCSYELELEVQVQVQVQLIFYMTHQGEIKSNRVQILKIENRKWLFTVYLFAGK